MTAYTDGQRVEYRARDELTAAGYRVIKAAGSKGFADLWAVRNGYLLFVSVKRGEGPLRPAARRELLAAAQDNGATALHVHPHGRGVLLWRELTGQAHDAWKRWEAT